MVSYGRNPHIHYTCGDVFAMWRRASAWGGRTLTLTSITLPEIPPPSPPLICFCARRSPPTAMAPKAAPPPPEPAAPPEDLFAAEEGEADVSDLVEELIARMHAVLDEKAELQRSVPFAVRAVTADMLSVVRCYYTECDRGEPQLATATSWSADAEPRPAMIDAWSRGAVPVKKRAPPPAPLVDASAPGSSVGGSRSQRSQRTSPRPKSREGGKEDGAAAVVVTAKAPPKSTEAAAPAEKGKKGGAMKTPEEERAARMAAEAKEETERLERLRQEVKGREYTYDQMGNVIVIETVNPERLPAYQYATRAGMAHEPAPEAVKGKKGSRRPPPAKSSALRFNQPAKYEELDSLQPPLGETMTMREGVSMTQDGSLTSGALPSTAHAPRFLGCPFCCPSLSPPPFAPPPRSPRPYRRAPHITRPPLAPPPFAPAHQPLAWLHFPQVPALALPRLARRGGQGAAAWQAALPEQAARRRTTAHVAHALHPARGGARTGLVFQRDPSKLLLISLTLILSLIVHPFLGNAPVTRS